MQDHLPPRRVDPRSLCGKTRKLSVALPRARARKCGVGNGRGQRMDGCYAGCIAQHEAHLRSANNCFNCRRSATWLSRAACDGNWHNGQVDRHECQRTPTPLCTRRPCANASSTSAPTRISSPAASTISIRPTGPSAVIGAAEPLVRDRRAARTSSPKLSPEVVISIQQSIMTVRWQSRFWQYRNARCPW